MKRFWILFFFFSAMVLLIFGIWGDALEALLDPVRTASLLEEYGWAAGPLGVLLLISDLFLPIPTTVIIGALGAVLGTAAGALWGWLGLTLSGWTGYGLARWGGSRWGDRLISEPERVRYASSLNRKGGLMLVLGRMLPVLPEVLSVMAGLVGMSPARFGAATTLGSLPPALIFSWIGSTARDTPIRSLILLTLLTAGLWLLYIHWAEAGDSAEKD